MYRFRVMFELSEEQIKKYIRYYERRRDWPVTLFLALSAAIFSVFNTVFWHYRLNKFKGDYLCGNYNSIFDYTAFV